MITHLSIWGLPCRENFLGSEDLIRPCRDGMKLGGDCGSCLLRVILGWVILGLYWDNGK